MESGNLYHFLGYDFLTHPDPSVAYWLSRVEGVYTALEKQYDDDTACLSVQTLLDKGDNVCMALPPGQSREVSKMYLALARLYYSLRGDRKAEDIRVRNAKDLVERAGDPLVLEGFNKGFFFRRMIHPPEMAALDFRKREDHFLEGHRKLRENDIPGAVQFFTKVKESLSQEDDPHTLALTNSALSLIEELPRGDAGYYLYYSLLDSQKFNIIHMDSWHFDPSYIDSDTNQMTFQESCYLLEIALKIITANSKFFFSTRAPYPRQETYLLCRDKEILLKSNAYITEDVDSIVVPAGKFTYFKYMHIITKLGDEKETKSLIGSHMVSSCIPRAIELWAAEKIGILRLRVSNLKREYIFSLNHYQITNYCKDFFPFQVGNVWQYELENFGSLFFNNNYVIKVSCLDDRHNWYIPFYAYCVRNKAYTQVVEEILERIKDSLYTHLLDKSLKDEIYTRIKKGLSDSLKCVDLEDTGNVRRVLYSNVCQTITLLMAYYKAIPTFETTIIQGILIHWLEDFRKELE